MDAVLAAQVFENNPFERWRKTGMEMRYLPIRNDHFTGRLTADGEYLIENPTLTFQRAGLSNQ
jgi:hypothetical protein